MYRLQQICGISRFMELCRPRWSYVAVTGDEWRSRKEEIYSVCTTPDVASDTSAILALRFDLREPTSSSIVFLEPCISRGPGLVAESPLLAVREQAAGGRDCKAF